MKDLMDKLISALKDIKDIHNNLLLKYSKLGLNQQEIVFGPFGSSHNCFIICIELIDNWLRIWDNPYEMQKFLGKSTKELNGEELSQIQGENFERVMGLLIWSLFIPIFSIIEFSMKNVLFLYSTQPAAKEVVKFKDKPYLIKFSGALLKPAINFKILTEKEGKELETLCFLRNSIVHNNAIAQRNHIFKGKYYNFDFRRGEMLRNKLDTFYYCSLRLVEIYSSWLENLLEDHFHTLS